MESDLTSKLSALRNRTLERDDESDPEGRIYRHKETGDIFHSVTRILGATMPEQNKRALERWLERPGSLQNRDMAATRGTAMHNNAEYVLKTAQRLARSTANKRNSWRVGKDGLYRAPKAVTRWAIEKAIAGAPKVPWSAAGFARGLRGWILDHVTAIHSIEFSIHHYLGFAGSADGLVDLMLPGASEPVLAIVDWKSTGKSAHANMDDVLEGYSHQCGAYALGLEARTGLRVPGAAVVVARRSGEPQCHFLDRTALTAASKAFTERCDRYFDALFFKALKTGSEKPVVGD